MTVHQRSMGGHLRVRAGWKGTKGGTGRISVRNKGSQHELKPHWEARSEGITVERRDGYDSGIGRDSKGMDGRDGEVMGWLGRMERGYGGVRRG